MTTNQPIMTDDDMQISISVYVRRFGVAEAVKYQQYKTMRADMFDYYVMKYRLMHGRGFGMKLRLRVFHWVYRLAERHHMQESRDYRGYLS